jgi:hypothetical protein
MKNALKRLGLFLGLTQPVKEPKAPAVKKKAVAKKAPAKKKTTK